MKLRQGSLILIMLLGAAMLTTAGGKGEQAATGPSTVTVWHHWASTDPIGQAFEMAVKEYNEAQSKYKVDALFMAGGAAAGGMIQKVLTAVASGDVPDVSSTNAFWVMRLAGADAIVPLDDLLSADELAKLKADTNIMGEFFDVKGKRMAWLVDQRGVALCYNKDMFKEAGLNPSVSPETWDDVVEFGRKLAKDTNGDGILDQYGYDMYSSVQQYTLIHWGYPLLAFGGTLMNADRTDVTFQEPPGVAALQLWVDLVNKYKISAVTQDQQQMTDFIAGRVAMGIHEIHILATRDRMGFDIGVGEIPKKVRRGFYTAGQSMVVMKDAKNIKGAVDFLKWFTSPEPATRFAMRHDNFPARKSGLDLPFYKDYLAKDPDYIPFAKSLEYSFTKPNVTPFLGMQLEIAKAIEAALYQKATPEAVLQEAAKVCREKLKKQ